LLTGENVISNVIRTVPLFQELSDKGIKDLATACTMLQLQPEETVFTEGDLAQEVFIVVQGQVRLTCETADGPDVVVGYVDEGGIIGEMGVIDPAPRSATARSSQDAVVLRLPGEAFGAFIGEGHEVAAVLLTAIRENMTQRIRVLNERIGALFLMDSAEGGGQTVSMGERLRGIWSAMRTGG